MRFSFVDVRKSLRDFGYELLNFFTLIMRVLRYLRRFIRNTYVHFTQLCVLFCEMHIRIGLALHDRYMDRSPLSCRIVAE